MSKLPGILRRRKADRTHAGRIVQAQRAADEAWSAAPWASRDADPAVSRAQDARDRAMCGTSPRAARLASSLYASGATRTRGRTR